MIKILLPTLNESDNIAKTVTCISEGLKEYYPTYPAEIINIDSNSDDKTVEVFNKTKSLVARKQFTLPNMQRGKGLGVYYGLRATKTCKEDIYLMLDSDVTSIDKEWIRKMIDPIILGNADYVIPIYTRNRYEGNTTNHICAPVIYSLFGIDIFQPIAGDFAFTGEIALGLLKEKWYGSDLEYGIDIKLTFYSLINSYRIKQIKLGRKIHKPSFNKILPTSTGAVTSLFNSININRKKIANIKNLKKKSDNQKESFIDDSFIVKPSQIQIDNLTKLAFQLMQKEGVTEKIPQMITLNTWVSLLVENIKKLITVRYNYNQILKISTNILPYYFIRVTTYFTEIENATSTEIESIYCRQKNMLLNDIQKY